MAASIVKRALYQSGLLGMARLLRTRARALVLRYHAVTETAAPVVYAAPDVCMPAAAFRLQMAFVARAYSVLAFDALVDALSRGTLPRRAVAITFDDGYADNARVAFPILRAFGIPATVYVATGAVGGDVPFWVAAARALALGAPGPTLEVEGLGAIALDGPGGREAAAKGLTRALVQVDAVTRDARLGRAAAAYGVDLRVVLAGTMLSWAQIRELADAGWTIGAHTVTHSNVALVDPACAEAEITGSRDALATATGRAVRHFCYPNSGGQHAYFGPGVVELLRRAGFRSATTSRPGGVGIGANPFLLPRVGVSPRLASVVDLAAAMERQRLAA
jgi:peptidoglycan/xylan/chitin deacetylase (PgdA/CDA1 family)